MLITIEEKPRRNRGLCLQSEADEKLHQPIFPFDYTCLFLYVQIIPLLLHLLHHFIV